MKNSLVANPSQARRTKQEFAKPDEQLSYELGKAVQELPPFYTRFLAGTITAIVFGSITWAHLSKVDEVATAPGKVVAATQIRPVTSLGNGSIVGVKVKEGDKVEKGEVVVQRDPDLQQADVARLAKSANLIREDLRRLDAERSGEKKAGNKLQDELLQSRLQDYQARQAAAEAEANRQRLELGMKHLEYAFDNQNELVQLQQKWRDRILFANATPVEPLHTCIDIMVPPKVHCQLSEIATVRVCQIKC